MKGNWTSTEKTVVFGGLLLAGLFIGSGLFFYLGIKFNFIRLN